MTNDDEVTSDMPTKHRSKPERKRPSADWGHQAVALAELAGKTKHDLAAAAGYYGDYKSRTIDRLLRGEGSMLTAYAVLGALRQWGLDTSKLPPLDEEHADVPDSLREWLALGERLHSLTPPQRFNQELDRVRQLVRAHELCVGEDDEYRIEPATIPRADPTKLAAGTSDRVPPVQRKRGG